MAAKPKITKRKVTMRNPGLDPEGNPVVIEAVDYVRPNFDGEPEDSTGLLDAYVADAQTRWQFVSVSDKPDAGPEGYEGETTVPDHLVGRAPADFAAYGSAATPENALDDHLGLEAIHSTGLTVSDVVRPRNTNYRER